MTALVLVEHDNNNMHPATRQAVSAALAVCPSPVFLVAGHQCQSVVEQVASIAGVSIVLACDKECYQHQLAEPMAELLFSLAESYEHILAPASTFGKNILPRLAAKLSVVPVSDVTAIIDEQTFERPIYAGNAIETVRSNDVKKLMTIRTTAFSAVEAQQAACEIKSVDFTSGWDKTVFVKAELSVSSRPQLGSAEVVVSGGRGLQNKENFNLIEELADTLGGAVGASRAAVDAGFVPNDYQVGQTGKIVAPALYFAVGISGAIQHLAGMKDSKVIVAINKDEDAPIFQVADYGLVGDLFEIVPELIQKLK